MEVMLLGKTVVKNTELYCACQTLTGTSPARKLDAVKLDTTTLAAFIASLAYFQDPSSDERPQEMIKNSGTLKDHVSCTFMIHTSREVIFEISKRTDLRVTSSETRQNTLLAVVSGTLTQWYAASLEFCSLSASFDLRVLYDKIVLILEDEGVGLIWKDTKKRQQQDQTFILEQTK